QHGLIEMETRSGRGDSAWLARIHGLIALPILVGVGTLYIRWQWHMTDVFKYIQHRPGKNHFEQSAMAPFYSGNNIAVKMKNSTSLGGFARANMRQHFEITEYSLHQQLNTATALLVPQQARRYHPGVVKHHQITRLNQMQN